MSQARNCPCSPECVLQGALNTIGGKWKLPVLCSLLANGASRYNELLRNTRGISNTMLSKTLKELEDDGLVRHELPGDGRGQLPHSRPGSARLPDRGRP